METVPVTLGAVLPGTSGVPPLFGKGVGSKNEGPSANTFLQQLQNLVAESYGGAKPASKVGVPVKQTEPEGGEKKQPSESVAFAAVPVPVPSPQLLSKVSNPDSVAPLTSGSTDKSQPEAGAAPNTGVSTEAVVVVPVFSIATTQERAQAIGSNNLSLTAPQVAHDGELPSATAAPVLLSEVETVEPAATKAGKKPHSGKDVRPASVREKAAHPVVASEAQVSQTQTTSNNFQILASAVSSNENTPQGNIQSGTENFPAQVKATESKLGRQQEAQGPPIPNTTVEPVEAKQAFAAAIGETLDRTLLTASSAENNTALKNRLQDSYTPISVPTNNAPQNAAQLHSSGPIQVKKPDLQTIGIVTPFQHNQVTLDIKSVVNDRSPAHDLQMDSKAGHAQSKTDEPPQKPEASASGHDDVVVPAINATVVHPAARLESVHNSGNDTSVLPQAAPVPTTPAPKPGTTPAARSEAQPAAPADLPALPPLPSDKIQAARLVDRLGQSEMHLGMRTESFGSVQVHTVIRDSQVGLTIGSERGDLKSYMGAEVPGLESNLRQHDLHFSDVNFVGSGFSQGGDQHHGAGSQTQSFQQGRSFHAPKEFNWKQENSNEPESVNDEAVGLSVHA